MANNEIFTVGVTNTNEIKIETPENSILLDVPNAEHLNQKLSIFINALKENQIQERDSDDDYF